MCFRPVKVLRLTKREAALEERLEGVCRENTELRSSLASLKARLALQDQLEERHSQQVHFLAPRPTCVCVCICVCLCERACVAQVSVGLWRALPNKPPRPCHCKVYLQSWIPFFFCCWFSFGLLRRRNLESGIWHVRIFSTPRIGVEFPLSSATAENVLRSTCDWIFFMSSHISGCSPLSAE